MRNPATAAGRVFQGWRPCLISSTATSSKASKRASISRQRGAPAPAHWRRRRTFCHQVRASISTADEPAVSAGRKMAAKSRRKRQKSRGSSPRARSSRSRASGTSGAFGH